VLVVALVSLPIWLFVFTRYRLYWTRAIESRLSELHRVVNAVVVSVAAMATASVMLKLDVARAWLLLTLICVPVVVMVEREILRRHFRAMRKRGKILRRVVIAGTNADAEDVLDMFATRPWLGYDVVGFLSERDDRASVKGVPVLGRLAAAVDAIESSRASGAIIVTSSIGETQANRLARDLLDSGVRVELTSGLRDIAPERVTVHPIDSCPMLYLEPVHRNGWRARAKRSFDIVLAAFLVVLTAPILLFAALLVKLDSRGPILFFQVRVGKNGRAFRIAKLRTMVVGAEHMLDDLREMNEVDGPLFKIRDDPRLTRVGRSLRRFSIDELPQLWNVLRGEMSMVGPRPALPLEVARWNGDVHGRLRVKPGITGMWQVNGRNDATFDDYVRLDLYYVDNWSLLTDLAIIAKTVPTVISRRGAT
jgi:exopolysaccharide biosynthesis polyprenyl glycosylphosphotransferase